jgi:hypothetical protein
MYSHIHQLKAQKKLSLFAIFNPKIGCNLLLNIGNGLKGMLLGKNFMFSLGKTQKTFVGKALFNSFRLCR